MVEETEVKKIRFNGKYFSAVGRRKEASARVRVYTGTGRIIVNDREFGEYFPEATAKRTFTAPFKALGIDGKYDVSIVATGGGKAGQLEAARLGLSRALVELDESNKTTLRRSGLLTRDPRIKERKKYGLKRARKGPQFSKR